MLLTAANYFSSAWIEQILNQNRHLLEQFALDASQLLDAYSLVPQSAQHVLPDLAHGPVHEPIAAWAQRAPSQVAIHQREATWTYQQRIQQADTVAAAAALCLDRGERKL